MNRGGRIMTLLNFEMKRNRIALIVWTAAIALLIMVCLIIFPDMKGQVTELNAAFLLWVDLQKLLVWIS